MAGSNLRALTAATEANDVAAAVRLLQADSTLANCRAQTTLPLHWAVYKDRPAIVDVLLDHGADIESRDQDNDTTPLRYAVVYGRKEIVRLLIARGANPGIIEGKETSALQEAVRGASGAYEEYVDLPSREVYEEVVALLKEVGVE